MNEFEEMAKWHDEQARIAHEMRKAMQKRYALVEPLTPILDADIEMHKRFAATCRAAALKCE